MEYLELTIATVGSGIEMLASALTAAGFDDLVMEDQQEFEEFLEDNREYWDYIDEQLQSSLQGLSQIKLYLESGDEEGLARIRKLLAELKEKNGDTLGSLELTVKPLAQTNW